MAEAFNLLGDSVLVNLKIFLNEIRNRGALAIVHGCIHNDHVDGYTDRERGTPSAQHRRVFLILEYAR